MAHIATPGVQRARSPSAQRAKCAQQPGVAQPHVPGSSNTEWQSLRASQAASVVTPAQAGAPPPPPAPDPPACPPAPPCPPPPPPAPPIPHCEPALSLQPEARGAARARPGRAAETFHCPATQTGVSPRATRSRWRTMGVRDCDFVHRQYSRAPATARPPPPPLRARPPAPPTPAAPPAPPPRPPWRAAGRRFAHTVGAPLPAGQTHCPETHAGNDDQVAAELHHAAVTRKAGQPRVGHTSPPVPAPPPSTDCRTPSEHAPAPASETTSAPSTATARSTVAIAKSCGPHCSKGRAPPSFHKNQAKSRGFNARRDEHPTTTMTAAPSAYPPAVAVAQYALPSS